jgi:hypothetical protein
MSDNQKLSFVNSWLNESFEKRSDSKVMEQIKNHTTDEKLDEDGLLKSLIALSTLSGDKEDVSD